MSEELSQTRVKELFDYDAENGWLIRKSKNGKWKPCGYKPVCDGYGQVWIDGRNYKAHRVIWLWHYGFMPDFIDHKNRNRIDNRIENLRPATMAENSHNQELRRNNSSGYPGVSWHRQKKKYQTRLGVDNKRIFLGRFDTPEEAFLHYMLAKIKYHPSSPIAKEYLRELTMAG